MRLRSSFRDFHDIYFSIYRFVTNLSLDIVSDQQAQSVRHFNNNAYNQPYTQINTILRGNETVGTNEICDIEISNILQ